MKKVKQLGFPYKFSKRFFSKKSAKLFIIILSILIVSLSVVLYVKQFSTQTRTINCQDKINQVSSLSSKKLYTELKGDYGYCTDSAKGWKKEEAHSGRLIYARFLAVGAYSLNKEDEAKKIANDSLKDYFANKEYKGVYDMSSSELEAWQDLNQIKEGNYEN